MTHEVLVTDHLTFPVVSQRRPRYAEIGTLFRRKYKSELMLHLRVWPLTKATCGGECRTGPIVINCLFLGTYGEEDDGLP